MHPCVCMRLCIRMHVHGDVHDDDHGQLGQDRLLQRHLHLCKCMYVNDECT